MNKQRTRWLSALLAVCLLFGALGGVATGVEEDTAPSASIEPLAARFNDVAINNWFFNAVEYVAITGVMGGTSNTRFQPNMPFSRAMVVTTLFRIHYGRPANETDPRETPFRDVDPSRWYAPYVAWAYTNNITEGDNGRFAPMRNVDRQSFATLLFRYAENMTDRDTTIRHGAQWSQFADRGAIQSWAADELAWANYHGFITGETATTIVPGGATARAQAATIITRFLEGPDFLPPPAVNARHFLGQSFEAVRPQFGTLHESYTIDGANVFSFYTGIVVAVQNGIIVQIDLVPVHVIGAPFHFAGLSTISTRADARNRLGNPTETDHEVFEGISFHDYFWITNSSVIWLTFADGHLLLVTYVSRSFLGLGLDDDTLSPLAAPGVERLVHDRDALVALLND